MTEGSPQQPGETASFAVPTRSHVVRCLRVTAGLSILFMLVYSAANYWTGLRPDHWRIDFAFEQRLPFVPELTLVYSSMYLMFLHVPFVLRTSQELRYFTVVMVWVTVIAGVCFLLLPAEIGFDPPTELGWFPTAFRIADQLNQTYNLCPSLHVAYSVVCAEVFRRKQAFGFFFHLWALAIAVAAWLTYQHHLLDLIAGYALAITTVAITQRKFAR